MSTLSVATIKSQSTSAPAFQNSSGVEKGRLVSAWAHVDGDSFHVQSSFNVSSATDHGTGDYQINFTNSFSRRLRRLWFSITISYIIAEPFSSVKRVFAICLISSSFSILVLRPL